jgi:hypothetical protein
MADGNGRWTINHKPLAISHLHTLRYNPRMKKLALLASLVFLLPLHAFVFAQRPASAPATAPAVKAPDTVLLEELTWAEVRDLIKAGTTTIIVGTAGTEQKGPHMVDGEHKFVMEYTGDKIARALGKTVVAPVVIGERPRCRGLGRSVAAQVRAHRQTAQCQGHAAPRAGHVRDRPGTQRALSDESKKMFDKVDRLQK